MKINWWILCLLICLIASPRVVLGQIGGLTELDHRIGPFLERQQIRGLLPHAHLSHRPISWPDTREYLDSLSKRATRLSSGERMLLRSWRLEAPKPDVQNIRSVLPFTYENGHDALSVLDSTYSVRLNPIFYGEIGGGRVRSSGESATTALSWTITGGFQVSGTIGDHLFFESHFSENVRYEPTSQRLAPGSRLHRTTLPRRAWVRFAGGSNHRLYEFWDVQGVVGVQTSHVELRFGRSRNHWGYGGESVYLSDFAPAYDQLQIRTTVGPIQYTNLFARFENLVAPSPGLKVQHRYGAFHRLDVQVTEKLSLAAFEGVVFGRDSVGHRPDRFDIAYMNPLIFYRAVEGFQGSPDNMVLGAGLRWRVRPGFGAYGQLLLDEFRPQELIAANGWWGNKWAYLVGVEFAPDVPPGLTVRTEYARVRPFTYSHRTSVTSYLHNRDVLGFPLGPNQQSWSAAIRYQPDPHWQGRANLLYSWGGRNPENKNRGADPTRSYQSRAFEYGNSIGKGVAHSRLLVEAHLGWQLFPDLFVGPALRANFENDGIRGPSQRVIPLIVTRWNRPFESEIW